MGVTTMKMMSSTSMMSAMGTTFGSEFGAPTGLFLAMLLPRCRALNEIVHQLRGRVVHFHVQRFRQVVEIVVGPYRRYSDEQSDGRSYQRFRDAAGDRR